MKIREIPKVLDEDGREVVRTRGSHRVLKHPDKPGIVVVPGHPGDDVAPAR